MDPATKTKIQKGKLGDRNRKTKKEKGSWNNKNKSRNI